MPLSPTKVFTSLSPEQRLSIQEEIRPVLSAVAERIHYAESRRATFSVIAGVMIAGGLALLTLALGTIDLSIIKYPISAAAICFTLLGILIFLVFSRQTNRYPWTSATKTWKWFYRDALPRQAAFDLGWLSYLWFGREKTRIQHEYGAQLSEFEDGLKRLADKETSLEQDAEQLYVLHVNEKYKNLHLTHLRTVTNVGLLLTFPIVLLSLLWGAWVDHDRNGTHRLHYSSSNLRVDGEWRTLPVAPDAHQSQILLRVRATNQSAASLPAPTWRVANEDGWLIPSDTTSSSLFHSNLPPKSTVTYTEILRTGEIGRSDAKTISVDPP